MLKLNHQNACSAPHTVLQIRGVCTGGPEWALGSQAQPIRFFMLYLSVFQTGDYLYFYLNTLGLLDFGRISPELSTGTSNVLLLEFLHKLKSIEKFLTPNYKWYPLPKMSTGTYFSLSQALA